MKKGGEGGAIVLFSSVAAIQGFPMHASVSMAKGAVSGLTLALAAELAPRIRVNAIAPSLTRTPLAEQLLSNQEAAEALAAQHPLTAWSARGYSAPGRLPAVAGGRLDDRPDSIC
jgi:NAD(P)-dependent dehydrogenase (short-subunit alcohol dehydrogenase family)